MAESRAGLAAGQVLETVALVSWTEGDGRLRAGACACHRPLVKVKLSVAASVSPEVCFGGSVVNQRAGPEANTPLQGLSSHWIPCGPWQQGRAVEVSRNWRLRGGEACAGRAPDSLAERAGARDVLKLSVNPTNFCFLWQLTATAVPSARVQK